MIHSPTRPTSFRLSAEAEAGLTELMSDRGLNRSQVIEMLLTGRIPPKRRCNNSGKGPPAERPAVAPAHRENVTLLRISRNLGTLIRLAVASRVMNAEDLAAVRRCIGDIHAVIESRLPRPRGRSELIAHIDRLVGKYAVRPRATLRPSEVVQDLRGIGVRILTELPGDPP